MQKHFIAVLDTGGIKYSGRQIVALGASPSEARTAAVKQLMPRGVYTSGYGDVLRTVEQVEEYFGIAIYGPLADNEATEV